MKKLLAITFFLLAVYGFMFHGIAELLTKL